MPIRKLKVPGIGHVEVDVQPCEYVKAENVHVQKIAEKFYVVKHSPYSEKTDMQIIAGIKGMESQQRENVQEQRRREAEKKNGTDPIVGHIGQ